VARTARRDVAHARKSEAPGEALVNNLALVDERGRLVELETLTGDVDATTTKDELDRIQPLYSAILRSIPDLMFVIRKDGTYLGYRANDPKMLYVPPSTFIGKTIRQVMPHSLAGMFADAIGRALGSLEPVEVTYELPVGGVRRSYEARLTACDSDRVVALVRDLTEIKKARAQSHDLAGRLIASQEMERMRIARELHDDLGQRIALLNIEIDRLVAPGSAMRKLVQSQKRLGVQVGELVHYLNQLAHQLHPSKVHTLGLTPSIQSICAEFSKRSKISASFAHGALPRSIDTNVSLCLYRITQEALHNVFRHSRARHVSVKLDSVRGALSLQIVDDGAGFDALRIESTGLGLISMRERVGLLGGTLQIHSTPQTGTRITAKVPLPQGGRRRPPQTRDV